MQAKAAAEAVATEARVQASEAKAKVLPTLRGDYGLQGYLAH